MVIHWGILSTSNIGRAAVIPAIHASNNGEVTAVASRDAHRASEFAEANEIPSGYGSYEALLQDERLDAIYIPLPNSMHHEWAIRCAEAGKHVLCEKPLALTAKECLEMEAAARANGVKLMEAFMYRFHPRTERVVRMVREGALGKLQMIRSAFTFRLTKPYNIRLDPKLGGGSLMDVGCYCVNVSRTIAGAEPLEVQAIAEPSATGVDARMIGVMTFPDGLFAQFDCALTMERREVYEVAGSDAWLEIPRSFLPGTDDATLIEHRGRGDTREHTIEGADEYQLMVEHFADAVLSDTELRYTAREAAANMRVIQALYSSAEAGGQAVPVVID